jgi:hypothetical protein
MQEAKVGLGLTVERRPVAARGFEQREGAQHIGAHELARPMDAAVDVALGREVDDRARPVLGQQRVDPGPVADVALDEDMPRIAAQRIQVVQIAGVGERVEGDHALVRLGKPVIDEIAANEAGAAGDEDRHGSCSG